MTTSRIAPRVSPRAAARLPLAAVRAVVHVAHWPVDSQLNARRNALVASTRLTALSHERQQVEDFLDLHARRWQARRVPRIGPVELAGPVADAVPLRAAL